MRSGPAEVTVSAITPCPWSALCPPHHAVRTGSASQSRGAWFTQAERPQHYPRPHRSRVPATGPRRNGTARPCPEPAFLGALLRGGLLAPAEVGAVRPHTMENTSQLAGQGHLGPLRAASLGNLKGPALEGRDAD